MSVQIIEQFAAAPAPGFRCVGAGKQKDLRFLARVEHKLLPPAAPESLEKIGELLGAHAAQVVEFFKFHNGFVLYGDTLSESAGVVLLSVDEWENETEAMRDMFDFMIEDPETDPDRIMTGVAIATVPMSANYFVMPVEGPAAGKIFYADHDGWYESAFADDFNGFLERVTREPVRLIAEELGCCTRYSDGKTETQWIPEEYYPDVSGVSV